MYNKYTRFLWDSLNIKINFLTFGGVWNFILYIILCLGQNQNTFMCDIDDQNAKHVFVSKGTQAFEPKTSISLRYWTDSKSWIKE
jgi:hypothetical protein